MTMFGIFWGTCSIVLLFAFGKGMTEAQLKSQLGLGENIAIFWPGITGKEYKGLPRGRRVRPTEKDVELIKKKSQLVNRISPEYSKWNVAIKYKNQNTVRQITGIWPEFGEMRNIIPDYGSRFINDRDMKDRRRVVFIGNLLKDDLFGDEDAVGKQILMNGMPFTVIGVMKPKKQDSSYGNRDSRKACIPASTFQAMYSNRYMNNFVAQCKPEFTMEQTRQEIYTILGEKYKFDPSDREALSVWDTTRGFAFLKTFFTAFSGFLVGIGIATLITGAIGVSNIMNVVLEERTKEIGIKMALGAKKYYIMLQFIFETLLITFFGGLFGFLFAWGVIAVFPMLQLEEFVGTPSINIWGGVMVTIVLGIVSLVAGYFPARRASNLQPVQALKLF
ncbi:MAG: ABC transporter permease [Calditrichaeota bacterium]|nr:MAG: ABC transporter permease [Calditrichota bacterium]